MKSSTDAQLNFLLLNPVTSEFLYVQYNMTLFGLEKNLLIHHHLVFFFSGQFVWKPVLNWPMTRDRNWCTFTDTVPMLLFLPLIRINTAYWSGSLLIALPILTPFCFRREVHLHRFLASIALLYHLKFPNRIMPSANCSINFSISI